MELVFSGFISPSVILWKNKGHSTFLNSNDFLPWLIIYIFFSLRYILSKVKLRLVSIDSFIIQLILYGVSIVILSGNVHSAILLFVKFK